MPDIPKRLPHRREKGATYFVTWRLHRHQPKLHPGERTIVADSIRHFDGDHYSIGAFVVMDDHVHLVICPAEPFELDKITQSWRSFTANRLQREFGRTGEIWQIEPFDRIIRSTPEYRETSNYILNNPYRRWESLKEYQWLGYGTLDR